MPCIRPCSSTSSSSFISRFLLEIASTLTQPNSRLALNFGECLQPDMRWCCCAGGGGDRGSDSDGDGSGESGCGGDKGRSEGVKMVTVMV